jgi:hypothetical protein
MSVAYMIRGRTVLLMFGTVRVLSSPRQRRRGVGCPVQPLVYWDSGFVFLS